MNVEQHEQIHHAFRGPRFHGEKIAGPQRFRVAGQEIAPCSLATLPTRIDARFIENVPHRRSRDVLVAELFEFAKNSRVPT